MLANSIYIKTIKKKKTLFTYNTLTLANPIYIKTIKEKKKKKRSHCTPKEKREGKLKKKVEKSTI